MKKNFKKIVALLTMTLMAVAMTGCSEEDNNHAYAEVKTESGRAWVFEAHNTTRNLIESRNGLEEAIQLGNKIQFENAGDKATIHFVCETCGHDETLEVTVPESKVLSCDCPEYDDLTGEEQKECENSREYIALVFVVEPAETEEPEN